MRHAHHAFQDIVGAEPLQQFVQAGNERFSPFQAEALGAGVASVQVLFQAIRRSQPLQDAALVRGGQRRPGTHRLQLVLHPDLLVGLNDVHVLGADAAAVGHLQGFDDLAQLRLAVAVAQRAGIEDLFEFRHGQAVIGQVEYRHLRPFHEAQRVDVGLLVTPVAIGGDECQNAHLLALVLALHRRALSLRARLETVAADALEMLQDAAVRYLHRLGARIVLERRQASEIALPLRRQVFAAGQVFLIHRFDVCRVGAREVRASAHAIEFGFGHGRRLPRGPGLGGCPRMRFFVKYHF